MREVPLWVVASLGKQVHLANEFTGPCRVYNAGSPGQLASIQCFRGEMYATVLLDPDDDGYEENFPFEQLRPVSTGASFSLDFEAGAMRFQE